MAIADLLSRWAARADELAPYAPPAAVALRVVVAELEAELRAEQEEILSLADAATASGYSSESLRHMVASGQIPNAGKRGAPRIRRGDLPKRVRRVRGAETSTSSEYNPTTDALSIVRRSAQR